MVIELLAFYTNCRLSTPTPGERGPRGLAFRLRARRYRSPRGDGRGPTAKSRRYTGAGGHSQLQNLGVDPLVLPWFFIFLSSPAAWQVLCFYPYVPVYIYYRAICSCHLRQHTMCCNAVRSPYKIKSYVFLALTVLQFFFNYLPHSVANNIAEW